MICLCQLSRRRVLARRAFSTPADSRPLKLLQAHTFPNRPNSSGLNKESKIDGGISWLFLYLLEIVRTRPLPSSGDQDPTHFWGTISTNWFGPGPHCSYLQVCPRCLSCARGICECAPPVRPTDPVAFVCTLLSCERIFATPTNTYVSARILIVCVVRRCMSNRSLSSSTGCQSFSDALQTVTICDRDRAS